MERRLILLLSLAILLVFTIVVPIQASEGGVPILNQQATAVPTTTGNTSTVQIFFVACNDRGILNFSGTMQTGYDLFYVVSTGTVALTSLRQVNVNGAYQVSDTPTYANGQTLAAGAGATVQVSIARESDSSSVLFQTTVNDLNDGCNSAQFAPATSVDTSSPGAFPITGGTAVPFTVLADGVGSGILSPFGGYLNPTYVQQPQVAIGPRDAANPITRNSDAGLIFAECNSYYPAAAPGLLYDSDNVVVFWSWFTRTEEQMQEHLEHAQYSVTLNNAIFPIVEQTVPQVINNRVWVFWIARVGNLLPGFYGVAYRLTWDAPVNDGFDDYGPGTDFEEFATQCDFRIQQNPFGITAAHDRSFTPWTTVNGNLPPPVTR
jgi:hypothetical protein